MGQLTGYLAFGSTGFNQQPQQQPQPPQVNPMFGNIAPTPSGFGLSPFFVTPSHLNYS